MESSCQIDFSATENTIRQDIQATLTHELNKLMKGSSLEQQGFQKLFSKFISLDKQENVVWEEIKKPSPDSVSAVLNKFEMHQFVY